MPEETPDTSDDPDWLKQVLLSLLVGTGPFFVDTSSAISTGPHTRARDVFTSKTQATDALVRSSVAPVIVQLPHLHPPLVVGIPSEPTPPAATSTTIMGPELQISQQVATAPSAPQSTVRIYSYGNLSFSWQSNKAVTFSSLPGVWACIAMRESSDMIQRSNPASSAKGAFQIKSIMWAKYKPAGYPANPNAASLSQQYRVALRIFRSDGFAEWETAPLCGV